MKYRRLGKTGLMVSEIGFGGEWLENMDVQKAKDLAVRANELGINIVDCWMSNPDVRSSLGNALRGMREKWYIQGHIGSTWQDGQYVRTRELGKCREAFEDLLTRLETDYIDLGMIHYIDSIEEWENCINSDFIKYVFELKEQGKIRHIGLSTHNPEIGKIAAKCGFIEMIMFSVNPAFDMLPATDDLMSQFDEKTYDGRDGGIDPERAQFYRLCESLDIGITVMKPFEGGRLLDSASSPFGTALSVIQCLHYCLTRPAVAAVMAGFSELSHIEEAVRYENASESEKDYATVLANAPAHAYDGLCTYCGHCKPCPVNIDIAMVNKLYDLAVMHENVPSSIKEHYGSLSVKAGACIGCRLCQGRCPFHVKVAEKMKAAAVLFGK